MADHRLRLPGLMALLALVAFVLLSTVFGCATAPPPLPGPREPLPRLVRPDAAALTAIAPKPPQPEPPPPPFPDTPAPTGTCGQLPGGILVAGERYAQFAGWRLERDRLRIELDSHHRLLVTEREAVAEGERAYLTRIDDLENSLRQAQTPSLWQQVKFWVGLGAGVGLVLGGAWTVKAVAR